MSSPSQLTNHARVEVGVDLSKPYVDTIFDNHCLEGKLTFDSPFQKSGVVVVSVVQILSRSLRLPTRKVGVYLLF